MLLPMLAVTHPCRLNGVIVLHAIAIMSCWDCRSPNAILAEPGPED